MDYYKILGVEKNATADEIKVAYRKLASKLHPDKGGSKEEFQQLEQAYRTLSDPALRADYDRASSMPPPGAGNPFGFEFSFGGFPFQDMFAQFHQHHQHQQHSAQLPVYRTTISLTLEQVSTGASHVLNLQNRNGTNLSVTLQSPPGIEHGQQIRYDNLMPGGVLLVSYIVAKHLFFSRAGADIISDLNISVLDLIIGKTIIVQNVENREYEVTIPAGTQPTTILRIPGAGLPVLNSSARGDLRIKFVPTIPRDIPEPLIETIRKYRNICQ